MNLINIGIEEFKKEVYPEYIKIFPKEERKELKTIEQNYDKKIIYKHNHTLPKDLQQFFHQ